MLIIDPNAARAAQHIRQAVVPGTTARQDFLRQKLLADLISVAQVFGPEAVSELRQLGLELNRPSSTLCRAIDPRAHILDPKHSQLASVIPNALIALHGAEQSLGSTPLGQKLLQPAREIPSLIHLARGLANLDRIDFAVFELEFHDKLKISQPVVPLWTRLSAGLIERLGHTQLGAYNARISLLPEGKTLQAKLERQAHDPTTRHMQRVMSIMLFDGLRGLGQDVLDFLRGISAQHAESKFIAPNRELMATQLIASLQTDRGEFSQVPKEIIDAIANIIHEAWKAGRDAISSKQDSLSRDRKSVKLEDLQNRVSDLPAPVHNVDRINALTLIQAIGRLPDHDYQCLRDSAVPGNPANIALMERIVVQSDPIEFSLPWSHAMQAVPKSGLFAALLYDRASLKTWEAWHQQLIEHIDRQADPFLQNIFRKLDTVDGILHRAEVENIFTRLAEYHELRQAFLYLTSFLSCNADFIAKLSPDFNRDFFENFLLQEHHLIHCSYRRMVNCLQSLHALSGDAIVQADLRTAFVSLRTVERYSDQILQLIGSQRRNPEDTKFRIKGGVVSPYYTTEYMQKFLAQGGRLVVREELRKAAPPIVHGALFYFPPGTGREGDPSLPPQFIHSTGVSYSELIVSAESRPAGTVDALFKYMVADLQLRGTKYTLGFVFGDSTMWMQTLRYSGRVALELLTVNWPLPGGRVVPFVPMIYPVSPKMRRDFGLVSTDE